jgi:hypothetical protein
MDKYELIIYYDLAPAGPKEATVDLQHFTRGLLRLYAWFLFLSGLDWALRMAWTLCEQLQRRAQGIDAQMSGSMLGTALASVLGPLALLAVSGWAARALVAGLDPGPSPDLAELRKAVGAVAGAGFVLKGLDEIGFFWVMARAAPGRLEPYDYWVHGVPAGLWLAAGTGLLFGGRAMLGALKNALKQRPTL